MALVKIAAILVFIFACASFVKPHYWHPFMPNGFPGVLTGAAPPGGYGSTDNQLRVLSPFG